MCLRVTRGELEKWAGETEKMGLQTVCRWPRFSCASLINIRENLQASNSGIWTWEFRRVRNSPTSSECQVAWRNKHTCIDKSDSKTCIRNRVVSIHPNRNKVSNDGINRCDKTSCTGSVGRFMRLIPREDNPNKKTLIYIPYTPRLHRLSMHNLNYPQ